MDQWARLSQSAAIRASFFARDQPLMRLSLARASSLVGEFLGENQGHRTASVGIAPKTPRLVGGQTHFQVLGMARVVRAVGATEYVDVVAHVLLFLVCSRRAGRWRGRRLAPEVSHPFDWATTRDSAGRFVPLHSGLTGRSRRAVGHTSKAQSQPS